MIEFTVCPACGAKDPYLKKKGPHIGLWCSGCGKFIQWVGKKDLEQLKHRGFKVHDESYVPENSVVQTNLDVTGVDVVQPSVQNHSVFSNNLSPIKQPEEVLCPTCASGVLDTLSKSDDVCLSILDGMMFVRNRANTKLLGTFIIKHCPSCGRKL